jgi:leucyl aminopeptidase
MLEFSLGSDAADLADTPCVVVGIFEGALSPAATAIDTASGGGLTAHRQYGELTRNAGGNQVLHEDAGVK